MLRVILLLTLCLCLVGEDAASSLEPICPDGATLEGAPPPNGDSWGCFIQETSTSSTRHGWSVDYWPNGNRKVACEYDHGTPHGRCSTWKEDGQLASRGRYEYGKHSGYWWFWGALEHSLYLEDGAVAREKTEESIVQLGVAEADAPPLTEYLIKHHRDLSTDIRGALQLCTASACVSAATIDGQTVVAVQIGPPPSKASSTDPQLAGFVKAAGAAHKQIQKERARRDRKLKQAQDAYESKVHAWGNTSLQCSDGTRSPSCVCGGGSQGCCSHHGGVAGCPRDYPEHPQPDTSPLVPNPLLQLKE